jgi:hypothetical protein
MTEKLNQEALEAAFLISLAQAGITPDVQELLVRGNPSSGVAPGALRNALSASLAERTRERDEARERLAAKIREVADLQQDPMWRLKEGMRERAEAAEAGVKALTEALRDIAWQKLANELEDDDVRGNDWQGAYEECVKRSRAALAFSDAAPAPERLGGFHQAAGTRWRHLKTGGIYTILGTCRIEASNEPAYLYRGDETEIVWARPMDEFLDGRFEALASSDAAPESKDAGRVLKDALFALEGMGSAPASYGGVLTKGGKYAWLEYTLRDAAPESKEGECFKIAHDGFEGTLQGRYVTREGKRGVVLQQIGTRVVHVYGEKWLEPAPHQEPQP